MNWRYGLAKHKNPNEDSYTVMVTEVYLTDDKPIAMMENTADLSVSFTKEGEAEAIASLITMLEQILEDCKSNAVLDADSLPILTDEDFLN
jgi:NAD(P)H-hydrate repair Nnr-like enzyme with NAD(P)H-hydrate dehydratase domain